MYRSYRYRLYPTRRQSAHLEHQLRGACALYNAALEHRRWLWSEYGIALSYRTQSAELQGLRRDGLVPGDANFWSQQEVLRRLDRAFAAFLQRRRKGERVGYPRFKAEHRFRTLAFSFVGHAGGVAIRDGRLHLQGVGDVKLKWHRALPHGAVPREVRITRRPGGRHASRFYAAFHVELPDPRPAPHTRLAVGIDVGVRSFARLSTGEEVEGPRAGRAGAATGRRLQRSYARTRRGSKRRRKAAVHLARHRERERQRRLDHAHKASRTLAVRFSMLAVEDLDLLRMLRSARGNANTPGRNVAQKRGLNREISDQAWGRFIQLLAYKAEEAGGRVVKVDPRGTSQTCAVCGRRDQRSRSGARFRCASCEHAADADTNAARVILARAFASVSDEGPGRGLQAQTDTTASVA